MPWTHVSTDRMPLLVIPSQCTNHSFSILFSAWQYFLPYDLRRNRCHKISGDDLAPPVRDIGRAVFTKFILLWKWISPLDKIFRHQQGLYVLSRVFLELRQHVRLWHCSQGGVLFGDYDHAFDSVWVWKIEHAEVNYHRSERITYITGKNDENVKPRELSRKRVNVENIENIVKSFSLPLHPRLNNPPEPCHICGKLVNNKKKHMKSHNPEQHKCPFCPITLTRGDNLKRHLRMKHCSVLGSDNLSNIQPKFELTQNKCQLFLS